MSQPSCEGRVVDGQATVSEVGGKSMQRQARYMGVEDGAGAEGFASGVGGFNSRDTAFNSAVGTAFLSDLLEFPLETGWHIRHRRSHYQIYDTRLQ